MVLMMKELCNLKEFKIKILARIFSYTFFFKFTRHAGCPILFGPKWVRKLNKIAKNKSN